jgi:uncharacterized protein (TIGR03437 family)
LSWPVAQTSPGVFAALNQDGTVNSASNPAAAGSIISLYAAGLGPITPAQADGTLVGFPLPNNVLPVTVEYQPPGRPFGPELPVPLEVTYAGPAPYLVAGASQINIRVVANARAIFVKTPSAQCQTFGIYVAGP